MMMFFNSIKYKNKNHKTMNNSDLQLINNITNIK